MKGFISLSLTGWIVVGLSVALSLSLVGVKVQTSRLEASQARFERFKAEVVEMGRKAQERVDQEKARQARVNKERASSYEKRIANLASAYQRVLGDPGSRPMPPISNAPVCPDGTAHREQLLAVLRAADEQTAKLIELQEWVRQQAQ